jgi:hypothetical protein
MIALEDRRTFFRIMRCTGALSDAQDADAEGRERVCRA